jgi:hypothetical protein
MPSRASRIAGSNSAAHGSLPWRWCSSHAMATSPGTPTLRPPHCASSTLMGLPLAMNRSGRALAGACSRPSSDSSRPVFASCDSTNAPPPIPEDCGSTTVSATATAIAASAAVPPRRSISSPASDARTSALVTTAAPLAAVAAGARCSSPSKSPLARRSSAGAAAVVAGAGAAPCASTGVASAKVISETRNRIPTGYARRRCGSTCES